MANEQRLIDANALVDWLTKHTGFRGNCEDCTDIDCLDCIIENAIKNATTVDAVEVVHGRWERMGEADYKCPVCGFRFTSADPISMFQYCRCGAKMDGDGDV